MLSQNVGTELQLYAACIPEDRRSRLGLGESLTLLIVGSFD